MPEDSPETVLDPTLLSLLACPRDKGQLHLVRTSTGEDVLYNPRLRRAYRIEDGIPVLLSEEARVVDDAEHAAWSSHIDPS